MLKNIVIVSDFANINGGGVAVAIETASLLAESGYNVYFFTGNGEPDKKLTTHKNIKIISTGQYDILNDKNRIRAMLNGIYNFRAGKIFRQLLSTLDKNETVIHIHQYIKLLSVAILREAYKAGFKVFFTIHDYFTLCPTGGFYNFQSGKICEISPMSLKCILSNCDFRHFYHKVWRVMRQYVQNKVIRRSPNVGYIYISEFSRGQLLRRMQAPKNQFFVHNPVYFSERFRIKAENNSLFTFIGRLAPEKGVRIFCEAVHNSGVKGVVIGDGSLRSELEQKYTEITFTGWLDKMQIREWLKKARCLVFPSVWYETLGLVPLEVSAYGIPVIAPSWSAASDNASFVYHSQPELEDIMRKVNTMDIKQLSEGVYSSFDETVTTNYADNLMKIYESPLE